MEGRGGVEGNKLLTSRNEPWNQVSKWPCLHVTQIPVGGLPSSRHTGESSMAVFSAMVMGPIWAGGWGKQKKAADTAAIRGRPGKLSVLEATARHQGC